MPDETARVDLDAESRAALEYDAVLRSIAAYASTAIGGERIAGMAPWFDAARIEAAHRTVAEARAYLRDHGRLLPARLPDPRPAQRALGLEGMRVDVRLLRDLATVLYTGAELGMRLSRLDANLFPGLRRVGEGIPDLENETRALIDHVDSEGRVDDGASAELQRLRASLARVSERLRGRLESMVRDPDAEAVVQDEFVTQRNGRFVIPIRTDAPRPVRGIVHAASSSGATLFVEPMETVEMNNELVRLAENEREELDRLVSEWTAVLRSRLGEIARCVDEVARIDSIESRARFADDVNAVRPRVSPTAALSLDGARHPLLDRRLRDLGQEIVPLDLVLDPAGQVLVLSGPNLGGKTVALKTIGLAVLMAQSGIPVVARDAVLPLFGQVRADIGDHQSIDADLSTFSAHMEAVVRTLRGAESGGLFLFDEIGTGTEPREGAALSLAVLEQLLDRGITTVATTHQSALKAWASATAGAASAAMEFDTETLRPTYRILLGAAGISAGFEIAERLGLDAETVARARGHLGSTDRMVEEHLIRLRRLVSSNEARRRELEEREAAIETERRELRERAAHETERARAEASRALGEAIRKFRRQAMIEIEEIRDRKERGRMERRQWRAEGRLRDVFAKEIPAREEPPDEGGEGPPPEIREGRRVRVRSLGGEGIIERIDGDRVEVRIGAATFTVRASDLGEAKGRAGAPSRAVRATASPAATTELRLVGERVDDAIRTLDKFLDTAILQGAGEVRVIHGHGTGRLRSAVREFLSDHPHVAGYRRGSPSEGGDGATVVTLREPS